MANLKELTDILEEAIENDCRLLLNDILNIMEDYYNPPDLPKEPTRRAKEIMFKARENQRRRMSSPPYMPSKSEQRNRATKKTEYRNRYGTNSTQILLETRKIKEIVDLFKDRRLIMYTTWRDMIAEIMKWRDETFDDVEYMTLSEDELDTSFKNEYGSLNGVPFTLWTHNRVYFPVMYDGLVGVSSVPRNPCGEKTDHVGLQDV
jgi:hypothetical protein